MGSGGINKLKNTEIKGVAIKHGDLTICLPAPNRHADCIRYACNVLNILPPVGHDTQGFYLEDGTFLNRKEAKIHAINFCQIKESKFKDLYSEDLW